LKTDGLNSIAELETYLEAKQIEEIEQFGMNSLGILAQQEMLRLIKLKK